MINKQELFQACRDIGLFEYGATISGDDFRELCEIETIVSGTKQEFDAIDLQELGYSGMIRDKLLNEGKYFKQYRDGYKVLLPSENIGQVLSYMQSADNKLKRGIKLDRNTPSEFKTNSRDAVRMVMKQESIRKRV